MSRSTRNFNNGRAKTQRKESDPRREHNRPFANRDKHARRKHARLVTKAGLETNE